MAKAKRSDGRREWRNTTAGYVSAVQIKRGEVTGVPVGPGETVWLNEEEEQETAKAPRDAARNPFLPQPYEVVDPATDEVLEKGERPVFVLAEGERFVPARGSHAPGEEVGNPAAQSPGAKAARRRRSTAGAAS